jgi:hypothetical protein
LSLTHNAGSAVVIRPWLIGTMGAPPARNVARVMGHLSKRRSPNRSGHVSVPALWPEVLIERLCVPDETAD